MEKENKKDLIREDLVEKIQNYEFFFDGEEPEFPGQFRFNEKTQRFLEKFQNHHDFDEAVDLLKTIVEKGWERARIGASWRQEEEAYEFKLELVYIDERYRWAFEDRPYVKAIYRRDGLPVFALHD